MLTKVKAALTATMLSSVALIPATTVGYLASADLAYAKSAKAGGKGNGGGKGAGSKSAKAGGKSDDARLLRDKGKGNGGSKAAGKSRGKGFENDLRQMGDDVRGLFRKATGQKPKKTRPAQSMVAKGGKADKTVTQSLATLDDDTRPVLRGARGNGKQRGKLPSSTLGNMNGALNANENAIAAHLRNGNTNGPVGLMAAYVAGRATTAAALDELGPEAGEYVTLNHLLVDEGYVDEDGTPDLQAYVDSGDMNADIDDVLDGFTTSAQDRLLIDNGYVDDDGNPDLIAYQDSGETIEGFEGASDFDSDLYDDVLAANEDLIAEKITQDALVTYWNKSGSAPEGTEDHLRDQLEARALYVEETASVMTALDPLIDDGSMDDDDDGDDYAYDGCLADQDDCAIVDDDVFVVTAN